MTGDLPAFLEQKLRSSQSIDVINSSTFGAKMPRADWTFIGNMVVAYPPTHAEQTSILDAIGAQTASLQTAIDRARREIDLAREFRTRLIADVVTGKVDVRSLAPADGEVAAAEPEVDEGIDAEMLGEADEGEFLRGTSDKWFCSELVAAALRDVTGWQIDPAKARPSTAYFHLVGKG